MAHNLIDLSNKKFGKLTVIQRSSANKRGNCMWECLCDCGNSKLIESCSLRRGYTKSCGCIWSPSDKDYLERMKNKLLKYSQKNGECLNWTGKVNIHGYGETKNRSKRIFAHRAAYLVWKGEIPSGLFVLHTCDNRRCINPDHLWIGTSKDNVRDMISKNRHNFYGLKS